MCYNLFCANAFGCINSSSGLLVAWEVVVYIVGVLAQFLWEAQAHKVSGR